MTPLSRRTALYGISITLALVSLYAYGIIGSGTSEFSSLESVFLLSVGLSGLAGTGYAALRQTSLLRVAQERITIDARIPIAVLGAAVTASFVFGYYAYRDFFLLVAAAASGTFEALAFFSMWPVRGTVPKIAPLSEDWATAFVQRHSRLKRIAEAKTGGLKKLLLASGRAGNASAIASKSVAYSFVALIIAAPTAIMISITTGILGLTILAAPLAAYSFSNLRLRDAASERASGVEKELPFFSVLAEVLTSAGTPLYDVFLKVAGENVFPKIAKEGTVLKKYVKVLGMNSLEALERLAAIHPSQRFSSFITGYCYDEETEVLTNIGWKKFTNLDGHERVLSLDPSSGIATFVKPTWYYKEPYEGWVYDSGEGRHNFVVTPGHKMFCKGNHRETKFRLRPIEEMAAWQEANLTARFEWKGHNEDAFILPKTTTQWRARGVGPPTDEWIAEERALDMRVFLEFLGWYVSEGCVEKGCTVSLTQKKQDYAREIEDVITRMGFKVNKYLNRTKNAWRFRIYSRQLAKWLLENCYSSPREKTSYTKKVPDFVKDLTPGLIEVFLASAWKGDGSDFGGYKSYGTYSKRLADDIQELLLRCGRTAKVYSYYSRGVACYTVYNRKSERLNVRCKNIVKRWYGGMIGCVEVPSHIVMVRRRGCPMWSGNTSKMRSGGALGEYFSGESSDLLRNLESAWARYGERAGGLGSMMLTLFVILPILILITSLFASSAALTYLSGFTFIAVPIFTVAMIIAVSRMQPTGQDPVCGNPRLAIAFSMTGALPSLILNQLWIGLAAGLFVFSTFYGLSVLAQRTEAREVDEAVPRFLGDLMEYKRQEYDIPKAIIAIARENKYNAGFNAILERVGAHMQRGDPLEDVRIETGSRLAKMAFMVLGEMALYGGGSVDTLNQLSIYVSKVSEARSKASMEMKTYIALAYVAPLFLAFGIDFTRSIVFSFSSHISGSLVALPVSANLLKVGYVPPALTELSNVLIVVTSAALGLISAKIVDFTVKNTLRVTVNVAIAILSTFVLGQFDLLSILPR